MAGKHKTGGPLTSLESQHRRAAAAWMLVGASLSTIGFMHSFEVVFADVIGNPGIALTPWAFGYLLMAAILYAIPWITTPLDQPQH